MIFPVLLAAGLLAFLLTFRLLSPILLSLLLILLISLAVNPVITRMRALTGGRTLATGLMTAVLVTGVVSTGWVFLVPMKDSVTRLGERLPAYWDRLQKPLIMLEQRAVVSEKRLQAEVTREIGHGKPGGEESVEVPVTPPEAAAAVDPGTGNASGALRSTLGRTLQGVAGGFSAVAFNAAQIVVVLVTVFFGVIYTLMNPRPVFGAIFLMVPERHHDRALLIVRRVGEFVPGWAAAMGLGMGTIGLLTFLLMWPIFGFTDALALGLIAGVFEAVPYLGPILSAVPALLFALGEGGLTPVWVVLAYLAIQALENNVVLPFFMARGMKLHPMSVIFSMLLCVAAFGVLGVLVAAPLVGIADILHDELYRKRLLPSVTDAELARLARRSLHEEASDNH